MYFHHPHDHHHNRTHPQSRREMSPSAAANTAAATALADRFAYLSASEPRPPRTPPTTRLHSRYFETPDAELTPPAARGRPRTPRFGGREADDYEEEREPRLLAGRRRRRGTQVMFASPPGGGGGDGEATTTPRAERAARGNNNYDEHAGTEEDGDIDTDEEDKPLSGAAQELLTVDAAEEAQASKLEKQFFDACKRDNTRAIERLLAVRRDLVYATWTRLNTPLHIAAEYKRPSVAQLLLESGANVDEVNQDGQTPLHLAAAVGSRALIRLLGNAGATIDARSKRNYTPLHMATSRGYVSAAMRLIDLGADVDAAAKGGIRPLHIAAFARDDVLVTHLLDRGASIDAMDDKRLDALNYAMMSQSSTVFHVIYSRILDKFKTLQQENEKLQRKAHEAKAQVHLIQDSKWLSKIPPLYTVIRLPSRRKSVVGIIQLASRKEKLMVMVHSQISGDCFHEPLELEIARDQWRELQEITIGGLYFLASLAPEWSAIVARGILSSVEKAVRRRLGREEYIRQIMDNLQTPIDACLSGNASSQDPSAPATHPYQLKKLLATYDKDFHWTKIPQIVRIKCAYHKKWRRLVWASEDEIQSQGLELFYHPPSGAQNWMNHHGPSHPNGPSRTHGYAYTAAAAARPSSTGSGSKRSSSFGGDELSDDLADEQQPQPTRNPLMSVALRLLNVHCRLPSDFNNALCEWRLENRVSSMVHDAGRFWVRSLLQPTAGGAQGGAGGAIESGGGVIHPDALTWNELRDSKLVFRVLRTTASGTTELVKEFTIEAKYELEFDRSSSYRCSWTKRLACDALVATLTLEGKRRHYAGRLRAPSG